MSWLQWRLFPIAPSTPAAPTTTVSGADVAISWTKPDTNGSNLTAYTILIQKKSGSFVTDTTNCNGIDYISQASPSCTVPLSALTGSPFLLLVGDSVNVKLTATNAIGTSGESPTGNGAQIVKAPSTPVAPTIAVSSTNVIISWSKPATNGSNLTAYTILIH